MIFTVVLMATLAPRQCIHTLLYCSAWTITSSQWCIVDTSYGLFTQWLLSLGLFLSVSGVIASCIVDIVICCNGKRTWMTISTYSVFSLSFKLYILFNSLVCSFVFKLWFPWKKHFLKVHASSMSAKTFGFH